MSSFYILPFSEKKDLIPLCIIYFDEKDENMSFIIIDFILLVTGIFPTPA